MIFEVNNQRYKDTCVYVDH